MPAFLSDDWIAALDEAARSDDRFAGLSEDLALTVQQEVVGGPDGDVTYHVRIAGGEVRVRPGEAPDADVRFHQDHATAVAIASGARSAQRAFMAGDLRVGGDLQVLTERGDLLAALGDAFASVRATTPELAPAGATTDETET